MENNPLINRPDTKNDSVPFEQIKHTHFTPAIEKAIKTAKTRIEEIKSVTNPTFENIILPYENASDELDYAAGIYYNLLSAEAGPEIQKLAEIISPQLANYSSDINLDKKLFNQIKTVFDGENKNLDSDDLKILDDTYTSFTRNGALLSAEKKDQLRELDQKLSVLSPKFSNNVLSSTNAYTMHLESKEDLDGLPDGVIAGAKAEAESKKLSGWVFNLQYPSFVPFMQYSNKRELRKDIWSAFSKRAFKDEFDNQENILQMIKLKYDRAKLLGFNNYSDYILRQRMAENPETVMSFLDKLKKTVKPAAAKDIKELEEYAKKDNLDALMPWDFSYYSEKLKKEKYSIDDELLRPYFKLENVIDGVFAHAKKLYGLEFKESSDYEKYHADVKTYEIYQGDKYMGLFYADFFPRETKKAGAWMTNYIEQGLFLGKKMRPHVSIVCNFTKPTKDKPSLLTFNEVRTMFHEFGHSLHSILSDCKYKSIAGTNVFWDFVELPSQIMENWILEKEGLDLFAKHYETGELIPEELTVKIKKASQFLAGYTNLRQLNFAYLDMSYYNTDPNSITNVAEHEDNITKDTQALPKIDGTCNSTAFSHIFAGGYSSGYYSYKWAEVLDADAFELFKEKGVFDKETADSFYKNILSQGGSKHPMKLYENFRGRKPDSDALLRRDGLI